MFISKFCNSLISFFELSGKIFATNTQYLFFKEDFQRDLKLLKEIKNKSDNKLFVNKENVEYLQKAYIAGVAVIKYLEPHSDKFQESYDSLNYMLETCEGYKSQLKDVIVEYMKFEPLYMQFLEWALHREPLVFPYNRYYYLESFYKARADAIPLEKWLGSQFDLYLFNLTLHNIIVTPDSENGLFVKHGVKLGAIGFSNSVSDGSASVSVSMPSFFDRMGIADSLLMQTSYGMYVLDIKSQLQTIPVVI